MTEHDALAELFGRVRLFAGLSRGQRARLARLATRRRYRPGDVIVRQGDTGLSLYILLSGSVRLERAVGRAAGVPIAELGAADFFGEAVLLDDVPRSASAVALVPTECALLARWDLQRELRRLPQLGLALGGILQRRLCALEARLDDAALDGQPGWPPATAATGRPVDLAS